jgi:hypothetical protein
LVTCSILHPISLVCKLFNPYVLGGSLLISAELWNILLVCHSYIHAYFDHCYFIFSVCICYFLRYSSIIGFDFCIVCTQYSWYTNEFLSLSGSSFLPKSSMLTFFVITVFFVPLYICFIIWYALLEDSYTMIGFKFSIRKSFEALKYFLILPIIIIIIFSF